MKLSSQAFIMFDAYFLIKNVFTPSCLAILFKIGGFFITVAWKFATNFR